MKVTRTTISSLVLLAVANNVSAFAPLHRYSNKNNYNSPSIGSSTKIFSSSEKITTDSSSSSLSSSDDDNNNNSLGLTKELQKLTDAFQNIGDDKLRYKQLLYMASNGLEPMPEELKIDDNKVLGCLSTVHVHASVDDNKLIHYVGDSDGLLTKGLVALLVRGLSGNTAEDIQKVDPKFIQTAGISQSLTPGRNNGFLNMLALMKKKALEVSADSGTTSTKTTASEDDSSKAKEENGVDDEIDESRPMYSAMMKSLQQLQPTHLELIDNSHEHAGHAGNTGNGTESHFQLTIVAEAFDGLNLVKRHQLIYMTLGDIMPQIHALQIQALIPEEAGDNN